jgi:hypothetical protein
MRVARRGGFRADQGQGSRRPSHRRPRRIQLHTLGAQHEEIKSMARDQEAHTPATLQCRHLLERRGGNLTSGMRLIRRWRSTRTRRRLRHKIAAAETRQRSASRGPPPSAAAKHAPGPAGRRSNAPKLYRRRNQKPGSARSHTVPDPQLMALIGPPNSILLPSIPRRRR